MKISTHYLIIICVFLFMVNGPTFAADNTKLKEDVYVLIKPIPGWGIYAKSMVPSPDSDHVACVARKGNKYAIIYDGKPLTPYDSIAKDTPTFSIDSEHMVYKAKKRNKWIVNPGF